MIRNKLLFIKYCSKVEHYNQEKFGNNLSILKKVPREIEKQKLREWTVENKFEFNL